MSGDLLREAFDYYRAHQDELVSQCRGRYVVIKGHQVLGQYDSQMEAIKETRKSHELGTFLVQKCEPGAEVYTQTYHSRVVISAARSEDKQLHA